MGSWTELDAMYPPGKLTPAAAFIVALGHLSGATSVYADPPAPQLAAFLPRRGLSYDLDMLTRAERYLRDVPIEEFLEEARAVLNPQQRRCLALNLLDTALLAGPQRLEEHTLLTHLLGSIGVTPEELQPYRQVLLLKNDLSVFPQ